MDSKKLQRNLDKAYSEYQANPKDRRLQDAYHSAYDTMFGMDHINSINRSYFNSVPGIVVIDHNNPPKPVSWGIFPENTHVTLSSKVGG